MINQKKVAVAITVSSLFLFLGCTGAEPQKETPKNETPTVETSVSKTPQIETSSNESKYAQVVNKTITDCKKHGIVLDEGRTGKFVHRFPQADIDKIVTITQELPKKNCQFFADETSVEKEEKIETLVSKAISSCKTFNVTLNEEALRQRAVKIPLVIIKRMLESTNTTSSAECQEMALQFKK